MDQIITIIYNWILGILGIQSVYHLWVLLELLISQCVTWSTFQYSVGHPICVLVTLTGRTARKEGWPNWPRGTFPASVQRGALWVGHGKGERRRPVTRCDRRDAVLIPPSCFSLYHSLTWKIVWEKIFDKMNVSQTRHEPWIGFDCDEGGSNWPTVENVEKTILAPKKITEIDLSV